MSKQMGYKVDYHIIEYRPEFIAWLAKKQTENIRAIQKIDDEIALAEIKAKYSPIYFLPILVPVGAFIGALIGLMIASIL